MYEVTISIVTKGSVNVRSDYKYSYKGFCKCTK